MSYATADVGIIAEQLRWNRDKGYSSAVLLGAGMSVSAGIPTATGIIQQVKDSFPLLAASCQKETYPTYMGLLAPAQRRDVIGGFVDGAKINLAHLYLGVLVKEGYVNHILTTNFDPLVVRSLALFNIHPAVYDFAASQEFIPGAAAELSVFHLHGQRDGFVLLHTEEEVSRHSEKLKNVFQDAGRDRTWIVIGYSGENDPVFERLAEIDIYHHKLFWVGHREEPTAHVLARVLSPESKCACYVKGYDADKFFLELAKTLGLPEPQIISRPFSHLKEAISSIAEYCIDDKLADLTRETKTRIDRAIEGFEEGKGFAHLADVGRDEIGVDEIIRRTRNAWVHGRFEEVEAFLKDARVLAIPEACEHVAFALYDRGTILSHLAQTKQGQEAEDLLQQSFDKYRRALDIKPDMHTALNNWGNALSVLAQTKHGHEAEDLLQQSIDKFGRALDIKPDKHEAFYNWGNALSVLAQTKHGQEAEDLRQQSIDKFQKAVDIKPDYYEALNNWGIALSVLAQTKQGQEAKDLLQQSIDKYRRALDIKPDYHEALNNWGIALSHLAKTKQGQEADDLFQQSFDKFQKTLDIKPDYHNALNNWGNALSDLARTKRGQQAENLFAQALDRLLAAERIKDGAAGYNIACVYALMGDTAQSLSWLEKALRMESTPSRQHVLEDDDLESIRPLNEFTRLLNRYRPE